jgi:hypothetical protein
MQAMKSATAPGKPEAPKASSEYAFQYRHGSSPSDEVLRKKPLVP